MEALDHTADDLIVAVNDYKKCSRKMEEIEDMSVEEILQVIIKYALVVPWCSVFSEVRRGKAMVAYRKP